jgi:hypothetical protein
MECRCPTSEELRGDEAFDYANNHLEEVAAEAGAWLFRCPITGQEWVLDTTREWDTDHGGRGRLRGFPCANPS